MSGKFRLVTTVRQVDRRVLRQNVATNIRFRPNRSPQYPNKIPPKGRAIKPIANVDNANKVAVFESAGAKKTFENTMAAIIA